MHLLCIYYFRMWSQNGQKCHWLCLEIIWLCFAAKILPPIYALFCVFHFPIAKYLWYFMQLQDVSKLQDACDRMLLPDIYVRFTLWHYIFFRSVMLVLPTVQFSLSSISLSFIDGEKLIFFLVQHPAEEVMNFHCIPETVVYIQDLSQLLHWDLDH